jgi:hypothetical protein
MAINNRAVNHILDLQRILFLTIEHPFQTTITVSTLEAVSRTGWEETTEMIASREKGEGIFPRRQRIN